MDALFNLLPFALATDSTRVITLFIGESGVPPIPGVTRGDHDLSHHGQEPEKLEQLRLIEMAKTKSLAGLLAKLKAAQEGGESLLHNTAVLSAATSVAPATTPPRTSQSSSPAAAPSTASTSSSRRKAISNRSPRSAIYSSPCSATCKSKRTNSAPARGR